jgi:hypothetical protein
LHATCINQIGCWLASHDVELEVLLLRLQIPNRLALTQCLAVAVAPHRRALRNSSIHLSHPHTHTHTDTGNPLNPPPCWPNACLAAPCARLPATSPRPAPCVPNRLRTPTRPAATAATTTITMATTTTRPAAGYGVYARARNTRRKAGRISSTTASTAASSSPPLHMLSSLILREFFLFLFFVFLFFVGLPPLAGRLCRNMRVWRNTEWLTRKLLCDFIRIQTWALEEARRRLEIEGILDDPSPKK